MTNQLKRRFWIYSPSKQFEKAMRPVQIEFGEGGFVANGAAYVIVDKLAWHEKLIRRVGKRFCYCRRYGHEDYLLHIRREFHIRKTPFHPNRADSGVKYDR